MNKVNTFIVGAPKCATTSLYRYLNNHPDVFMSTPKEINYFSGDELKRQGLYYNEKVISDFHDYENIFKDANEKKVIGEASVSYLFYPDVPKKIYKYNKYAKIIIVLRDPIERAFSHYLMDERLGYVHVNLSSIFENKSDYPLYFQQYFELGLYYSQVARYFEEFGEDNVLVLLDSDLKEDINLVTHKLCVFLDVEYKDIFSGTKHNVYKEPKNRLIKLLYKTGALRRLFQKIMPRSIVVKIKNMIFSNAAKPKLDKEFQSVLLDYYNDDIHHLQKLIHRDLSIWTVQ